VFKDKENNVIKYGFDRNQMRTSAGIAVQWLAPLGLFRFSLGLPLKYQRDTLTRWGDQTEVFHSRSATRSDRCCRPAKIPYDPNMEIPMRSTFRPPMSIAAMLAAAVISLSGCGSGSNGTANIRLLNVSTGYTSLDLYASNNGDTTRTTLAQAQGVTYATSAITHPSVPERIRCSSGITARRVRWRPTAVRA